MFARSARASRWHCGRNSLRLCGLLLYGALTVEAAPVAIVNAGFEDIGGEAVFNEFTVPLPPMLPLLVLAVDWPVKAATRHPSARLTFNPLHV